MYLESKLSIGPLSRDRCIGFIFLMDGISRCKGGVERCLVVLYAFFF